MWSIRLPIVYLILAAVLGLALGLPIMTDWLVQLETFDTLLSAFWLLAAVQVVMSAATNLAIGFLVMGCLHAIGVFYVADLAQRLQTLEPIPTVLTAIVPFALIQLVVAALRALINRRKSNAV